MTATATERHRPRTTASPDVVDAYLRRLCVEPEPVSLDALFRLHRAHVELVPYETFWLHLDQRWGIDELGSMARIATGGRGGYCFHLNGALARLLDTLGYDVTRHVAGVHDDTGPSPTSLANHVALIVHGLPSGVNPGGDWYIDAGLGDAIFEPIALVPGECEQGPTRFRMERVDDGIGDWHFVNDPAGSLAGVTIVDDPVSIGVFANRHRFNATSPESSFARTVTCQRRHATGVDIVRGRVLTRRSGTDSHSDTIATRRDWLDVLGHLFGLRLEPDDAVTDLWARVCAGHDQWLTEQSAIGAGRVSTAA